MQLRTALQNAIEYLTLREVGSPQMNAEVLLMFTLGCDRAYFFAHPERELSVDEQSRYEAVINERVRGVPSQYITGHQEFWGMDFIVNPSVLIPRPETEHIIETVLELLRGELGAPPLPRSLRQGGSDVGAHLALKIVDVGTGSGAIALALAKELPLADMLALDISPTALEVARANAVRLELASRVRFAQSDVLTAVDRDGSFDFVVSNPPYVGLDEVDKVQDVVKKFEPQEAVFAGDDGMSVIRRLIPQAHEALRIGGWLLMEIGFSMSQAVMALLGPGWSEVNAVPDLAGIPRVVVARKV